MHFPLYWENPWATIDEECPKYYSNNVFSSLLISPTNPPWKSLNWESSLESNWESFTYSWDTSYCNNLICFYNLVVTPSPVIRIAVTLIPLIWKKNWTKKKHRRKRKNSEFEMERERRSQNCCKTSIIAFPSHYWCLKGRITHDWCLKGRITTCVTTWQMLTNCCFNTHHWLNDFKPK